MGERWRGRIAVLLACAAMLLSPASAQDVDQLAALSRQFTQMHGAGRYAEAVDIARRAIRLSEQRFGASHPNTASWTNSLAEALRVLGRHAEAEPLYHSALRSWEASLGPDHPEVGTALNNLALLLKGQGRFDEAERHFQRALEIWEHRPGPQSLEVARALGNLGDLHRLQGRFGEAERVLRRSIAIREASVGAQHPMVATALNNLALVEGARGRYREAEPLYRRALSIWEQSLGPDHPNVATALDNLAEVYRAEERYGEAEPLYRRAIAIRERSLGPDHPLVANALNNLAILLGDWDRLAESEPLLARALAIRQRGLGPSHPDVAASLNNLAELHRELGRLEAAEPLYRRALAIWQAALGPEHPHVATAHNNLGNLYLDQARLAEADGAYQRALAIRRNVLGPDHPEVGGVLNNIAWIAYMQADWSRASSYWRQAADIAIVRTRRSGERLGQGPSGRSRSDAQREANRFAALVKAAYRVGEAEPGSVGRLAREMFIGVQWARVSDAASSLAQMAARTAAGSDALARLVRERQDLLGEWQSRDAALLAARSEPPADRDRAAEAALTQRLAAIEARLGEVDRILTADFPDYASLTRPEPVSVEQVQSLLQDGEALVLLLDTPAWLPTGEETFLWVVTRTQMRWIRSSLGSAALAREVGALRCGLDASAWEAEGGRRCAALLGVPAGQAMPSGGLPPFDLDRAHRLYRDLLGEAAGMIGDKHLLIVPSGSLNTLPFHVLVTEPPGGAAAHDKAAWLGTRNAITVLPAVSSLTVLRALGRPARASEAFVGFGNPLLTGPSGTDRRAWARQGCAEPGPVARAAVARAGTGLDPASLIRGGRASVDEVRRQMPLPETADELCAVARALGLGNPDGAVHLGARATEASLKRLSAGGDLARARVVHFATHGLLPAETASLVSARAEPSILLTPPEVASEEDDGLLTASEITGLKLDADWVILSACNTASGDVGGHNPLSGLARAFFYAGARSLLASHWYVDSEATVALVTGAFEALRAAPGIGRAEALRRSMAGLVVGGGRMAHPTSWAPFVVVGEGGAGR